MPASTTTCARRKGKNDGRLHQATPVRLLSTLLRAKLLRLQLDTALVDDMVLGCVMPVSEHCDDSARTAVPDADSARMVAGMTHSRYCASGLESVNLAAAKVASGYADVVVAGGVESMGRWAMGSDGGARFMNPRIDQKLDFVHQYQKKRQRRGHGQAGRQLRGDGQHGFGSHRAVQVHDGGAHTHMLHAGNSSGIVFGAALMLAGSREGGATAGLKPRACSGVATVIGSEPTIMLTGPTPACQKALRKAGMQASNIDL